MEPRPLLFDDQVASHAENMSINRFQRYLAEGSLRLRPAFQRNLVWNNEQKGFLIDTVLRGLPIPEIYVQITTSAEGEEEVIVVDGQQRISSCLAFLAGELRLVAGDDFDARWRGRTFGEIDSDLQKKFRSYELVVRKLPDSLREPILREIFRRLNKTVEPLTPQELRHAAYTGDFLRFIESVASAPVFSELGVFTAADYLRRRSDELVSEVLFAVASNAFPNKKEGLDELYLTYERQGIPKAVLTDLKRRVGRLLLQLEPIAGALRRTRFRNKSDFYTLLVLLARDAERLPLDPPATEELMDALKSFSDRVNDIKREESAGQAASDLIADDLGKAAQKYLRSVERAASDRLSRVRRNEALAEVAGPSIAKGAVRPLSEQDEKWASQSAGVGDEADFDEEEIGAEKHHLEEILLSSGEPSLPTLQQ